MSGLGILEYPDPRLRQPSKPVTVFDDDLNSLIDRLLETLYATHSIGLSAPQLNDHRQVLVADLSEDQSDPQIYVNPQILSKGAWGFVEERCLSVPDVVGNVIRATRIRVRAQDRHGVFFESDLTGMNAVCLQHEMDHLAGKLFVDRLSIFKRLRLRRQERRRRAA
ncbi:MAG: peptide deformylase [Alphaproteobacteria bacterium]